MGALLEPYIVKMFLRMIWQAWLLSLVTHSRHQKEKPPEGGFELLVGRARFELATNGLKGLVRR